MSQTGGLPRETASFDGDAVLECVAASNLGYKAGVSGKQIYIEQTRSIYSTSGWWLEGFVKGMKRRASVAPGMSETLTVRIDPIDHHEGDGEVAGLSGDVAQARRVLASFQHAGHILAGYAHGKDTRRRLERTCAERGTPVSVQVAAEADEEPIGVPPSP